MSSNHDLLALETDLSSSKSKSDVQSPSSSVGVIPSTMNGTDMITDELIEKSAVKTVQSTIGKKRGKKPAQSNGNIATTTTPEETTDRRSSLRRRPVPMTPIKSLDESSEDGRTVGKRRVRKGGAQQQPSSRKPQIGKTLKQSPRSDSPTKSLKITKKYGSGRTKANTSTVTDILYDSYDFDDDHQNAIPLEPLRHVQVARSDFNNLKFTKAENDDCSTPKYAGLQKSAAERRSQTFKTPSSSTKSSGPVPASRRSNAKYSLSPGYVGDISSLDTRPTNSTLPKSTPSGSGSRKISMEFSSDERRQSSKQTSKINVIEEDNAEAGGSPMHKGRLSTAEASRCSSEHQKTPVLFSDIETKICDDFDNADFLSDEKNSKSPKKDKASSSRRKKEPKGESDDLYDSGTEDDLKIRQENIQNLTIEKSTPKSTKKRVHVGIIGEDSSIDSGRQKKRLHTESMPSKKEQDAPEIPELSPADQLAYDSQPYPNFKPGARVFVNFKKMFYPAHIVQSVEFARFKVKFVEDGFHRDAPYTDIIPLINLKPGKLLMVKSAEDELQTAEIEKSPSDNPTDWFRGIFVLYNQVTGQKEELEWINLLIDPDQSKQFEISGISKAQDVSEDNIISDKIRRNRGKRLEEKWDASPVPTTPRTPKTPRAAKSVQSHSTTPSKRKRIAATTPNGAVRSAKTAKSSKIADEPSIAQDDTYDEEEEELPVGKVFSGLKFVLTSANRAKSMPLSESSAEERQPFHKKQVKQMIEENGGIVIEDFGPIEDVTNCYLVADQYYRTHKYLSALARAIPCVSHVWIHDCCDSQQVVAFDNYRLPAGQSLESDLSIKWHDECPKLLTGLRVFVYTQNRPANPGALDFVQIWAPLVKSMGATVVDSLPENDETFRLDIMLTDVSCSEEMLGRAIKMKAFVVSSEWLIQAIITGRRPSPTAHAKYRYDYIEPPPSTHPQQQASLIGDQAKHPHSTA